MDDDGDHFKSPRFRKRRIGRRRGRGGALAEVGASHLAGVDALARRRERRLVLRLEHDVHNLEDGAIASVLRHDLAVSRVAAGEHARRAGGHHVRRGSAKHR